MLEKGRIMENQDSVYDLVQDILNRCSEITKEGIGCDKRDLLAFAFILSREDETFLEMLDNTVKTIWVALHRSGACASKEIPERFKGDGVLKEIEKYVENNSCKPPKGVLYN